jgi:D-serine deaminase-like pyridoxal phosphate-dependent protein
LAQVTGRGQAGARLSGAEALDLAVWGQPTGHPTPYVAVHRHALDANLRRVAAIAGAHEVALRPHIKTHKCIEIARLQLHAGAAGVTASKPQEALVFIEAGVPSVTVAYPIVVPASVRRLLGAAADARCDLRFVVDSTAGVQAIATALRPGERASAYVEVDVGLGRCGVKPGSTAVGTVARALCSVPGMTFLGLLSHAGHAYGAQDTGQIAAIADEERCLLGAVAAQLAALGIAVREVSVGSTPTVLAATSFDGVSEIRPGNYVFLDLTACRLGVAKLAEVALGVVTTVVSANERYCIIDAGSKVLSSDTGAHGTGGGGFGLCIALESSAPPWREGRPVARLSEEHGFVEHGGLPLAVGARALVIPNHSCPVANLADRLVVLQHEGEPAIWSVAARGRTA